MAQTSLYQKVLLCLLLLITLAFSAPTSQFITSSAISTSPRDILDNYNTTDLELELVKRDSTLYNLWQSIPNANKVTGSSAIYHAWDRSQNQAYGVTYLYGCTAILISDPNFVIVAHLSEEGNDGNGVPKCQLGTPSAVQSFIDGPLLDATSQMDAGGDTRATVIYGSNQSGNPSEGLRLIKQHLIDSFELDEANYNNLVYTGSSGTGEPIEGNPSGLAVVQWVPKEGGNAGDGNIKAYFSSDTPIRDDPIAA